MKTHQKGNTIESDLSFIFVGFLTFWISPTNRGKAQRGESTCQLLNGPSNVFDVCSEKKILSTHQRNLGVHRADDMCISDRVCADASNRWHVHKWFLGYVRLNRCHLPLVYINTLYNIQFHESAKKTEVLNCNFAPLSVGYIDLFLVKYPITTGVK